MQKVQYAQVQRCARQIFICMTIVPLHHIITEILLWRGAESRPCDLSHVGGQNPNHQLCRQRGWMGFIALYPSMQYPFIHCKLRRQIRVSTRLVMHTHEQRQQQDCYMYSPVPDTYFGKSIYYVPTTLKSIARSTSSAQFGSEHSHHDLRIWQASSWHHHRATFESEEIPPRPSICLPSGSGAPGTNGAVARGANIRLDRTNTTHARPQTS